MIDLSVLANIDVVNGGLLLRDTLRLRFPAFKSLVCSGLHRLRDVPVGSRGTVLDPEVVVWIGHCDHASIVVDSLALAHAAEA